MGHISTILIVDDDQGSRAVLEGALTQDDYRMVFATNGVEGLTRASEIRPDVVLLDVMMPGMDGYEVCQRLRADPTMAEVPIMMITALDDRVSRLRAIEAGADEFISKPFDPLELRTRVRTMARLDRFRRLHSERVKFQWVVERTEEGFLLLDGDGRVSYANAQARAYLGLEAAAVLPSTETFLHMAHKLYRREPEQAWVLWTLDPVSEGQSPLYLVRPQSPSLPARWLSVETLQVSTGVDAQRLIRLRDMSAAMGSRQEKWAFNLAMAHKFRTPLTNIISSLELLTPEAPRLPGDQVAKTMGQMLKAMKQVDGEIQDILSYLNLPTAISGDEPLCMQTIKELAADTARALGLRSTFVSVPANVAPLHVLLSRRSAELILWEILENSLKFHPQHAPAVEIVAGREPDGRIAIQICDDGVTLSPEQLGSVGVPYFQGDGDRPGAIDGMGLGLAMVTSLVWTAGGSCSVHNCQGRPGIMVKLLLPVVRGGKD